MSSSRVEAVVRSTRKVSIVVLPSHQNGLPRFQHLHAMAAEKLFEMV